MPQTTRNTAQTPPASKPAPAEAGRAGSRGASEPMARGGDDQRNTQLVSRAIDDVKEMGTELIAAVRNSATGLLSEQRNQAADQIAAIGEAVRHTGDSFEHDTGWPIGRYAAEAARQIGDFAETVRSRPWGDMAGDIEDFARRQPIWYMAAAVGIGFIAGRLLRSSAPPPAAYRPSPTPSTEWAETSEPSGGGARHDYGAVSGSVPGSATAGYGAARENG